MHPKLSMSGAEDLGRAQRQSKRKPSSSANLRHLLQEVPETLHPRGGDKGLYIQAYMTQRTQRHAEKHHSKLPTHPPSYVATWPSRRS